MPALNQEQLQLYYCSIRGNESGPFNAEQLKQLVKEGRLLETDLVRRERSMNWHPAVNIRGLFSDTVSSPDNGSAMTPPPVQQPPKFDDPAPPVFGATVPPSINISPVQPPPKFDAPAPPVFNGGTSVPTEPINWLPYIRTLVLIAVLTIGGYIAWQITQPLLVNILPNRPVDEAFAVLENEFRTDRFSSSIHWTADDVKVFRKAAEAGNKKAQFLLGYCCEEDVGNGGFGSGSRSGEAEQWFRKCTEQNYAWGYVGLARLEMKHRNPTAAISQIRKGADAGNGAAQRELAQRFINGYGVKQDLDEAETLLGKAEAQNFDVSGVKQSLKDAQERKRLQIEEAERIKELKEKTEAARKEGEQYVTEAEKAAGDAEKAARENNQQEGAEAIRRAETAAIKAKEAVANYELTDITTKANNAVLRAKSAVERATARKATEEAVTEAEAAAAEAEDWEKKATKATNNYNDANAAAKKAEAAKQTAEQAAARAKSAARNYDFSDLTIKADTASHKASISVSVAQRAARDARDLDPNYIANLYEWQQEQEARSGSRYRRTDTQFFLEYGTPDLQKKLELANTALNNAQRTGFADEIKSAGENLQTVRKEIVAVQNRIAAMKFYVDKNFEFKVENDDGQRTTVTVSFETRDIYDSLEAVSNPRLWKFQFSANNHNVVYSYRKYFCTVTSDTKTMKDFYLNAKAYVCRVYFTDYRYDNYNVTCNIVRFEIREKGNGLEPLEPINWEPIRPVPRPTPEPQEVFTPQEQDAIRQFAFDCNCNFMTAVMNKEPDTGETLLHKAAMKGNILVARYLVSKGAAVNALDKAGETPLLEATRTPNKDKITVATYLVTNGADINVKDKYGNTPLHQMAMIKNGDAVFVKFLIDNKADVNAKDVKDRTPLHRAAAVKEGNIDVAKVLVDNGADVNVTDKGGKTPLETAKESGNAVLEKYLSEIK